VPRFFCGWSWLELAEKWLNLGGKLAEFDEKLAGFASVITLKPAIRYQFKTGQRDWP
jgi:hypothetical protein